MNFELRFVSTCLSVNEYRKNKDLIFADNKRLDIDANNKISEEILLRTDILIYSGVLVNQNISWKDHITYIHYRVARLSDILHKTKPLI